MATRVCCLAAFLVIAASVRAAQDSYPDRPIRLVVGFGAGGPTDIPARLIADKLGTALGQRVVVENKPAAAGMMATRDVLGQPRDGYNLLLCTHFESINTAVYKNVQFKLADLAPISLISKYYYGLTLSNSIPANDLEAFIAYAKAHPGQVNYASIGAGSAQEIFARQLEKLAGIQMNRIPFRTGPQVMQELIPGRVQFYVSPMLSVLPLHQNKELKVLAVSSAERLASAPDVPTLKEKGIDFVRFGWLGICAGAGTPQPVIDLLNRHIAAIVASPDYQSVIERSGSLPVSSTPGELRDVIVETRDQVA
ncbi:MAG TPA: tripartite tricarboxylate transporter substrate binding protein, partial [Xanthobacteraceae bacterium]